MDVSPLLTKCSRLHSLSGSPPTAAVTSSRPTRFPPKQSLANHFNHSPDATSTCLPVSPRSSLPAPSSLYSLFNSHQNSIQTRSLLATALTLSSRKMKSSFEHIQFDKLGLVNCPYSLHRHYAVNGLEISDNTWSLCEYVLSRSGLPGIWLDVIGY